MSYRLKDEGFPYLKIYNGKKWIGRVYKNAQSQWVCQIGTTTYFAGRTSTEAFDEGVSRYMGYSSAAALRESNRQTKARNNVRRAQVVDAGRKYLSASSAKERWDAIDQLVDAVFPKPIQQEN